jgi:hypothetical protein
MNISQSKINNHLPMIIGIAVIMAFVLFYRKVKHNAVNGVLSTPAFVSAVTSAPMGNSASSSDMASNQLALAQANAQLQQNAAQSQANIQMQQMARANDYQTQQELLQANIARQQLAAQTQAAGRLTMMQNNPFYGESGGGIVGTAIGQFVKALPVIGQFF